MSNTENKFQIRINDEGKEEIFDYWRKKYVALTPEEWVRQHFLAYLTSDLNYPRSLISVEKTIQVNHMPRRFDAVVYNRKGKPAMLIEFKSPKIKLTQKTMEQAANYNLKLKVDYMVISNGSAFYCCRLNHETQTFSFLNGLPDFEAL